MIRLVGELDDAGMPLWMADAACLGDFGPDRDPWFTGDPSEALAICERCPSLVPCGEYGLAHEFGFGVFGGMSAEARKARRRDDRAA